MKYRFLEHTADAKFQAFGKSMEEAFGNAALAMFSIMVDCEKVKPAVEEIISATGRDLKALLYSFLEELLFALDTKGFVLHAIKSIKIEQGAEMSLEAVAVGDIHIDQYDMKGEVKAVTYNEMEISEGEGQVTLQVVVDL